MKLNKNTGICLAASAALLCLALSSYATFTNSSNAAQINNLESSGGETISGRDLTVSVENTFNPDDYSKHMYSYGITDSIIGDSLDELSDAAKEIIQGRIISLEYFSFEGRAHTKADVKVEKVISGSLQAGDTISVFLMQGYVPLSEQVAWEEATGGAKFKYSDEELKNTVIEECEMGEELAKVNDEAVFYLRKNAVKEMGGYARVNGGRGELLHDSKDNDYERATTADRDKNEKFTFEEIESAAQNAS